MTLPTDRRRRFALLLLAAVYLAAGALHLAIPDPFLGVTPSWVPHPRTVVAVTGACEIAGALALLPATTRRIAGVALALYALCVYPANVMHAVRDLSAGTGLGWAYHCPRLFVQPLICWWPLWATARATGQVRNPDDARGPGPAPRA